jgi:hypothetical protein
MVSLPPALMQFTDAGLAISVAGWVAGSDGVQALVPRAMMQRVAICGRCMSINRHVFFFKTIANSIVSVYRRSVGSQFAPSHPVCSLAHANI